MDATKLKLIIWDLDDTFWNGTLSEGPVEPIKENIRLVKELTNRGIINTICSKNDYASTIEKLKELEIWDYFVFASIDWTPKGKRIADLIRDMGLRPVNCLFLDDNPVNLNEAAFYSKDLITALPSEIATLQAFVLNTEETDINQKRLKQYKVLEAKNKDRKAAGYNIDFLYASNTQVVIHHNCLEEADRLFELVHRTNQLNFTKNRCSREDFDVLLSDNNVNTGYITVKDNYGDYGIVGFYALQDNNLIHFLFSCRTIGQGVEQWVYSQLGCPNLTIIGEVVNTVDKVEAPRWINCQCNGLNNNKIVLHGGGG